MARNITVIPARANRTNLAEQIQSQKKRMAAYCRVSTDQLEQLSSYEAQVNYYTTFINNSSEYEMAGIFADEGISGTNTKKRELKSDNLLQRYKAKQFMRIMENAEPIEEFDMDLFFRIIEKMTVFEEKKIIVTLLMGLMLKL